MSTTDKTNKMLVNVVLDRSGSMMDVRKGTIDGYNEYISGIRADKDSEYSVSLIQFDSPGHTQGPELTISYIDKPLADVPVMTLPDYEPRGGTPLYDAIGECIRRVEAKDRAVTVVIITDGQNNTSKEFTQESIAKLRAEKEAEGWTFVFIGADFDAYSAGASVGFRSIDTVSYTKGQEHNLYAACAQSTITRSGMNATMGTMTANKMAFFSDEQKLSVGDPTVGANGMYVPPPSVTTTVTGGGTATTTFRPHTIQTGKTPVGRKPREPRKWSETVTK